MSAKPESIAYYTRPLEAILFIAERPIAVEEVKQRLNIKDDGKLNKFQVSGFGDSLAAIVYSQFVKNMPDMSFACTKGYE